MSGTGSKSSSFTSFGYIIIAGVLTLSLSACGTYVGSLIRKNGIDTKAYGWYAAAILAGVGLVFALLVLAGILRVRKMREVKVAKVREYMMQRRDEVRGNFKRSKRKLHFLAVCIIVYESLFGVWAAAIAFAGGFTGTVLLNIAAFALFCALIPRIGLFRSKPELPQTVSKEDFPEFYALAERAGKAVGSRADIGIVFETGCNVTVMSAGKKALLVISALAADILDRDEFYQIMLHEMAHASGLGFRDKLADRTARRLDTVPEGFFSKFAFLLFMLPDSGFIIEKSVYLSLSEILEEQSADGALLKYGDPEKASTALVKTSLWDFFGLRRNDYLEPVYKSETPPEHPVTAEAAAFRKACEENFSEWSGVLEKEIESRSATHPVMRDRVAALGRSLSDIKLVLPGPADDDGYRKECAKALEAVDRECFEHFSHQNYPDVRRDRYLEPLERIAEWEKGGKETDPEKLPDICEDLFALCRPKDVEEACDRILAEYSEDHDIAHALFLKGTLLLGRLDPAGIDLLYRAEEANSNYTDSALDMIGRFCCLLGLEDRLEEYRERSVGIAQEHIDKNSKADCLLPSDRLEPEALEGGMLGELTDYFVSTGEGTLDSIYLVRKIITDDFFTSAFVIKFKPGVSKERKNRVMHAFFLRLDTAYDWQFSLFEYDKTTAAAVNKIKNSRVWQDNGSPVKEDRL